MRSLMMKFNLSIDIFTESVRDAADVAQALRRVAHDLAKMSPPWRPLGLSGRIYDERSDRCIGTWSVDTEESVGAPMVAAENDPVSRVHCLRCGEHVRIPQSHNLCPACASLEHQ